MTTGWTAARPYFERAAVVHVATIRPDGSPHSVPVWIGVEGDRLALFMEEGSAKDEHLARDPRIALSVTNPDEPLDRAIVRGRAVRRLDGEEAQVIVDRIAEKYTGDAYDVRSGLVVYEIEPETASAHDYSAD